jgi:hypothetical protein
MSEKVYQDMRPLFSGTSNGTYYDARSDYFTCKVLSLSNPANGFGTGLAAEAIYQAGFFTDNSGKRDADLHPEFKQLVQDIAQYHNVLDPQTGNNPISNTDIYKILEETTASEFQLIKTKAVEATTIGKFKESLDELNTLVATNKLASFFQSFKNNEVILTKAFEFIRESDNLNDLKNKFRSANIANETSKATESRNIEKNIHQNAFYTNLKENWTKMDAKKKNFYDFNINIIGEDGAVTKIQNFMNQDKPDLTKYRINLKKDENRIPVFVKTLITAEIQKKKNKLLKQVILNL